MLADAGRRPLALAVPPFGAGPAVFKVRSASRRRAAHSTAPWRYGWGRPRLGLSRPSPWFVSAWGEDKTITIEVQRDRTGPTRTVGDSLCPGIHDYIALVNSRGGIDGWKISDPEVDNQDNVALAVEAYARDQQRGAVGIMIYGTPETVALNAKIEHDTIPATAPGFSIAPPAEGDDYPYLFLAAPTYWSQSAAAVAFIKEQLWRQPEGQENRLYLRRRPHRSRAIAIYQRPTKERRLCLTEFYCPAGRRCQPPGPGDRPAIPPRFCDQPHLWHGAGRLSSRG